MWFLPLAVALAFTPPCDEDNDSFLAATAACGGDDCNDLNADVFPGAPEACNGLDNDCDGTIDGVIDADGDGFSPDPDSCGADPRRIDCDDTSPTTFPQFNGEIPGNGSDDDCDGRTDEDDSFDDGDGDLACEQIGPEPCSYTDCDDNDPSANFSVATDRFDGRDEDCDGTIDNGADTEDRDDDGQSTADGDCDDESADVGGDAGEQCTGVDEDCDGHLLSTERDRDGDGVTPCQGDCDDTDAAVHPGQPEVPGNGLDDNCDGRTDDTEDHDGDGSLAADDCDDDDDGRFPGAAERCNGIDDDCDGAVDEDFDQDLDGVTTCGGDCDDTDATAHPGRHEWCDDERDNDCNGLVDDDTDADGDGWSTCDGDCLDDDPSRHPTAGERDNGRDDDCDGAIDEGFDTDGDGFTPRTGDCDDTDPSVGPTQLEVPCDTVDNDCDPSTPDVSDGDGDGSSCDLDCDDDDERRSPAFDEVCGNGIDEDCSGQADACDTGDTGTSQTVDTGPTTPEPTATGDSGAELPRAWWCATGPAPGSWLLGGILFLFTRRRRPPRQRSRCSGSA